MSTETDIRATLPASLRLYAVTERSGLPEGVDLGRAVEEAILGGATFIQLREVDATHDEKVALARELQDICKEHGVPFVVNDDVEVARIVGADGVHVGQGDMPVPRVREILGPDAIVGVSAQSVAQGLLAQEQGADYLGIGPLLFTNTKPDAELVPVEELIAMCDAVDLPAVGIGGMNASTIADFAHTGVDGFAVVSAIFSAPDARGAARQLRERIDGLLG